MIGYTLMRTMGIGSIGTLQAKGLIKERQPILLAEFENRTPDSTLAPTLTEAFRVDLSQSQSVKLMDGEAVSDALRRMQKPENAVMTVELARQLAQREGVPAVVVGEIDRAWGRATSSPRRCSPRRTAPCSRRFGRPPRTMPS